METSLDGFTKAQDSYNTYSPDDVFNEVLYAFYDGRRDNRTLAKIGNDR